MGFRKEQGSGNYGITVENGHWCDGLIELLCCTILLPCGNQLDLKKMSHPLQVNCETDFVARNVKFQQLVQQAATATLEHCRSKQVTTTDYTKVCKVFLSLTLI